jgi:hypothetical protein
MTCGNTNLLDATTVDEENFTAVTSIDGIWLSHHHETTDTLQPPVTQLLISHFLAKPSIDQETTSGVTLLY